MISCRIQMKLSPIIVYMEGKPLMMMMTGLAPGQEA